MNLDIYEKLRAVPNEAKKAIGGGRLKGMTDINPMWRIKSLTEQFGPCGIGWYYEIKDRWLETCMAKDEITANVNINLYVKVDGEWSKPIPGIGGSMLVASERNGLYVNDECYKMALTDALSVACKALGMGADVYWQSDNTKYNDSKRDNYTSKLSMDDKRTKVAESCAKRGKQIANMLKFYNVTSLEEMSEEQLDDALNMLV